MEKLHVNHSWELKAELYCYLKRKKKKNEQIQMVTKKLFDPQKQMQNNNLMKSVFKVLHIILLCLCIFTCMSVF